ncbi:flagellin N-terminal helical domain-containing protein [Anaerotruncus colihominis]|uniref:flagellin N-terminal helical domain-containing protein n=1 Tax=Anaerotruncus colihominis TaxID=169435 RepID=UPI0004B8D37F|nr:flagellin [Anaerotruncus colihominis]UOX65876.1 flagellin [Anaerotruncus colihominis]
MGMVVRSNIMAVNAQRQLGMNNSQVGKALEKLSSGYRINRAGDDASGLAISEKMKAQIKGLDTASLNSQDGISLVQTAEGALTEVHNMLNRMTELATRSANGINEDSNRASLQKEVAKLQEEIDRISKSTNFNNLKLLDGSQSYAGNAALIGAGTANGVQNLSVEGGNLDAADTVEVNISADKTGTVTVTAGGKATGVKFTVTQTGKGFYSVTADVSGVTDDKIKAAWSGVTANFSVDGPKDDGTYAAGAQKFTAGKNESMQLQIGDTADSFNQLKVGISDMSSKGLGIDKVDISNQDGAAKAIDTIKNAIDRVSAQRATLGATQNRLEYTINNLDTASENLQAANSRIRDTDMAKMMMEYTKMNVLTQSAQAMLAQANQQPQSVLQLLQ